MSKIVFFNFPSDERLNKIKKIKKKYSKPSTFVSESPFKYFQENLNFFFVLQIKFNLSAALPRWVVDNTELVWTAICLKK